MSGGRVINLPIDFQQLTRQMRALIEAILATQQIKAFPIHPPSILRQHVPLVSPVHQQLHFT